MLEEDRAAKEKYFGWSNVPPFMSNNYVLAILRPSGRTQILRTIAGPMTDGSRSVCSLPSAAGNERAWLHNARRAQQEEAAFPILKPTLPHRGSPLAHLQECQRQFRACVQRQTERTTRPEGASTLSRPTDPTPPDASTSGTPRF